MDNGNINLAKVLALGFELGFAIAMPLITFLLLGVWLDHKFDTLPVFAIGCLLAGLITVAIEVKKIIVPFLEKRSQRDGRN